MIVGNGLIASLFISQDCEDIVFFASGVSNSSETEKKQFLREENLLLKTISDSPGKLFLYFSTCSIYDSSKTNSLYVLHKLKMEEIVKSHCEKYLIFRVSNAVGKGGNPNLLMNYLVRSVHKGTVINVHTKATRNLIDSEDVKNIVFQIIKERKYNKIINVAFPQNYTMIEILETIENYFNKKMNLNLVKEGSGYEIDTPETEKYFESNQKNNKESYLCKILEKYYSVKHG